MNGVSRSTMANKNKILRSKNYNIHNVNLKNIILQVPAIFLQTTIKNYFNF